MLHRLIWVVKCFCVMLFPYLCVSILTFKKYNKILKNIIFAFNL